MKSSRISTSTIKKEIGKDINNAISLIEAKQLELSKKYKININNSSLFQNNGKFLKKKLADSGITNPNEINDIYTFLKINPNPETITLRTLAEKGEFNVNNYLDKINSYTTTITNGDAEAYNVDQREFAIVPKGTRIGTTNLQQCVALIINDESKTALIHFDRFTTIDSLKQNITNNFKKNTNLEILVYGSRSLKGQMNIALDNMKHVIATIEDLKTNYKVDIKSIHTNLKLENINCPILEAKSEDIIFDGKEIIMGIKPELGNPIMPLKTIIRNRDDKIKKHIYENLDIRRDSTLYSYSIENCNNPDYFIKNNKSYNFLISEEEVHKELFDFMESVPYDIKFHFSNITSEIMPYYNAYKITKNLLKEKTLDCKIESESIIKKDNFIQENVEHDTKNPLLNIEKLESIKIASNIPEKTLEEAQKIITNTIINKNINFSINSTKETKAPDFFTQKANLKSNLVEKKTI